MLGGKKYTGVRFGVCGVWGLHVLELSGVRKG